MVEEGMDCTGLFHFQYVIIVWWHKLENQPPLDLSSKALTWIVVKIIVLYEDLACWGRGFYSFWEIKMETFN